MNLCNLKKNIQKAIQVETDFFLSTHCPQCIVPSVTTLFLPLGKMPVTAYAQWSLEAVSWGAMLDGFLPLPFVPFHGLFEH